MKIINVEKPKVFLGEYRVIIKDLEYSEYKSLIKLLKFLGMKENKKAEKRMYTFVLEGYKKFIHKKYENKLELDKDILKFKQEIKDSKTVSPIFENKVHSFQFTYAPKGNCLAGSWRSELFNEDEFFSLILSNN